MPKAKSVRQQIGRKPAKKAAPSRRPKTIAGNGVGTMVVDDPYKATELPAGTVIPEYDTDDTGASDDTGPDDESTPDDPGF